MESVFVATKDTSKVTKQAQEGPKPARSPPRDFMTSLPYLAFLLLRSASGCLYMCELTPSAGVCASLKVIPKITMTSGSGGEIRRKRVEEVRGEWRWRGRLIRDMLCGITAAEEAD